MFTLKNQITFNKYSNYFFSFMYIKKICRPGYYGNGCGHLCNGYCMSNGICNHVDGVCLDGCQVGYIGKYCNICKKMINNSFFWLPNLHHTYAIYLFYDDGFF